jgi:hypothetical protein
MLALKLKGAGGKKKGRGTCGTARLQFITGIKLLSCLNLEAKGDGGFSSALDRFHNGPFAPFLSPLFDKER